MPILNSHKPATFNGGTLTEGLAIADPDGSETQLTITGTGAGTAKLINASAVHTTLTIDSDGTGLLSSDDTMIFQVAGTNGTDGLVEVTGGTGNQVTLQASAGIDYAANSVRIFHVGTAQGVLFAIHSAPADGSINAGECALWFDQTNGAAKLMVKAKTADGTVATAAIALA